MELNQLNLKQLKQLAQVWNVQPTGDKRRKDTWVAALQAKRDELSKKTKEPTPQEALLSLKEQYNNYIPLFAYRECVSHLARTQQDEELYKLEKANIIDLGSLVEAKRYTPEQISQGIEQLSGCPLFFAMFN